MELTQFVAFFTGHLLALLPDDVEVHVSTLGPPPGSLQFVLQGRVGRRPFDHFVDGEMVTQRSEDWARSLAVGLALLTVQGD